MIPLSLREEGDITSVCATRRQRIALTLRTDHTMYRDDRNRSGVCGRSLVAPRSLPIVTQAKVWNV